MNSNGVHDYRSIAHSWHSWHGAWVAFLHLEWRFFVSWDKVYIHTYIHTLLARKGAIA